MTVELIIQDSVHLYRRQRYHSALCLALIAVDATACERYGQEGSPGYIKSSAKRFKTFLNDETAIIGGMFANMFHGVDLPPQPDTGEPPQFKPPELKDDDDTGEFVRAYKDHRQRFEQWSAEQTKAYADWSAKIPNVGDNFRGKRVKGGGWSHRGKPRLVSTTGILYEARCELVHNGKLSAIRVVPIDDERSLRISGIDPIEFSSTWVSHILGIVTGAKENKELLSTVMETNP